VRQRTPSASVCHGKTSIGIISATRPGPCRRTQSRQNREVGQQGLAQEAQRPDLPAFRQIDQRAARPDQRSKGDGGGVLYPEPKRGRGNKDEARKETVSVPFSRIKAARQIKRHSESLAEEARDGTTTLDKALELVAEAKKVRESKQEMLAELH
jgi:hypothetical protein